ncbi:hypothetical protein TWF173_001803 [Orbilia oligospora]|nr:hypothetical protein TWF173_001803 [Orbilia oligospora]
MKDLLVILSWMVIFTSTGKCLPTRYSADLPENYIDIRDFKSPNPSISARSTLENRANKCTNLGNSCTEANTCGSASNGCRCVVIRSAPSVGQGLVAVAGNLASVAIPEDAVCLYIPVNG